MSVKLFVTDLDGTVLPKGWQVSPVNIEAAKAAMDAGIIVAVATGRMYQTARPVAEALGVNVPVITYNGALIKSTGGKVYYESFLPADVVADVISFCEQKDWYIQSYSHDELCFPFHTKEAEEYEAAQHVKGKALGWDGLKKCGEHVCKLLLVTSGAEESEARIRALRETFGSRVTVARSNANYVEIINPGVSKAEGIRQLSRELGIAMEDVVAIGDSDNDLPMLRAAGFSIAMGNAAPQVKAVCDEVTAACEENGFAKAVYDFVLRG